MDNFNRTWWIKREKNDDQFAEKVGPTSGLPQGWPNIRHNTAFQQPVVSIYPGNQFSYESSIIPGMSSPYYNQGTEQTSTRLQRNSQLPTISNYQDFNLANPPFGGEPSDRSGYFSNLSTGSVSGPSHSLFYNPPIRGEFQRSESTITYENSILPSTSFHEIPTGELKHTGTRYAPIEIPDSPNIYKNESSQTGKRVREPECEAEILHMMKKAKKLHKFEIQNKRRPPNPSGWDGVEYVNGRMVIPIGNDQILDELLFMTKGSQRPHDIDTLNSFINSPI